MVCESCNCLCENTKDHASNGTEHHNGKICQYQQHFDNKIYLCKKCQQNGRRVIVKLKNQSSGDPAWVGIAKYAWNGYTIDCPYCGEIYRSRQYWYGNKAPESDSVISESIHVWKDSAIKTNGQTHSAQVILDGFNYLSETLTTVSAQPTSAITSWLADKIAPDYWRPNSEIIVSNHLFRKTQSYT
jgi:zinc finger FYVE domain-containing protein 1